ncbi:hypothetical protein JYQ62_03300 [Nostoc sp. UHCC 0702]|nr:hypothetical protein JYQ62_03300 [Nostoc sp. UHCC 0702]
MMSDLLFRIPIVPWVQETMQKMNVYENEALEIWSDYWYDTYKQLGGKSKNSGTKGCPRCAAYGLWYLGRLVDSVQTYKGWEITKIKHELGKNAAYTVLSLEILQQQVGNTNTQALWSSVRELYQQRLNEEAAKSEQGQIKIALALFNTKLIVLP